MTRTTSLGIGFASYWARCTAFCISVVLLSACEASTRNPSPAPPAPPAPQAQPEPVAAVNSYNVIPRPRELRPKAGYFELGNDTRIAMGAPETKGVAEYLRGVLRSATGRDLAIEPAGATAASGTITLAMDTSIAHSEGYALTIDETRVVLRAKEPRGLFYGVQTLRQLAPVELAAPEPPANVAWRVPAVEIEDAPRFAYRGMHLDVGRHFFPPDFVKQYIDLLASYKLNTFHWHLTEDQGWRIEIKKYPKLTEVGAYRKETLVGHYREQPHRFDGKRYGGFYTQEEVKDVVAYAQKRFVDVIPEIEMPGHALAALAAYPELGCTKGPFEVATKWGIFEDVLCPKEETFTFLEGVLGEVMELFPSRYIHIGADEVPKVRWEKSPIAQEVMRREKLKNEEELQSYFVERISKFVASKGRKVIGWDEILEGGLAPSATVMSWRGTEGGVKAARAGHDAIMTPQAITYFNAYQHDDVESEPLAAGGYSSVKQVYDFEPVPSELDAQAAKHIIGAQGCLWTEYIKTPDYAEYMVFPRLLALSEVVWADRSARNWEHFVERLLPNLARLERRGIEHGKHVLMVHQESTPKPKSVEVSLAGVKGKAIRYTTDGSEPSVSAALYQAPIVLSKTTTVRAVSFEGGKPLSPVTSKSYHVSLATGMSATYEHAFAEKYAAQRELALTDGLLGSPTFGDGRWLGFDGKDLVATFDLGELRELRRIQAGFLRDVASWIMLPSSVEFLVSDDGKQFKSLTRLSHEESDRDTKPLVKRFSHPVESTKARYVRVHAKNYGKLPKGHDGAGTPAWLFVDEILVE